MVAAAVIAFKFDHAREFTSSHASEPLPTFLALASGELAEEDIANWVRAHLESVNKEDE